MYSTDVNYALLVDGPIKPTIQEQILERDTRRRLLLMRKPELTLDEAQELCKLDVFYGLIPAGVSGVVYGGHAFSLK